MLKHISITFLSSVGILLANIFGGILTARMLGPEGKGIFTAISIWPGLLASLGSLGLVESIVYYSGKEDKNRINQVLSGSMFVGFLQSIILISIGLIIIPFLMRKYDLGVVRLSQLYLVFIPLNLLTLYCMSMLQGGLLIKQYNLARMLVNYSYILGLMIIFAGNAVSVTTCTIVLLLSNLITLIYVLIVSLRYKWIAHINDFTIIKKLLSYGIKSHIGNISSMVNLRLDQMVMAALLPPKVLGLYVVAVTFSNGANIASGAIATVTFPTLTKNSATTQRDNFCRLLRVNFAVSGITTLLLFVSANWFIPIFFGNDYIGSIIPAKILIVAALITSINKVLESGLKGLGRPIISTYAELVGFFITVILLYILIPKYQIMGASFTSLVAYTSSFIFMIYYLINKLKIKSVDIFKPRASDFGNISIYMSKIFAKT